MAEKMKRSGNSRSRWMTYVKRQFTSFAHKGRVEDIFLRYFDHNDEHKELKRLKYEAEILDKLGSIEALERKLADLNWKKYEAEDKMRSYNPDMTKILTISEAVLHQQFVMDAILRIEKLKNKKLLEQEVSSAKPNDVEMLGSTAEGAASSGTQRTQLADDHNDENIEQPEPSASEGHILEVQVS